MTRADIDIYRYLGRDHGLAVGLAAVLDGLDPATAGHRGLAAVPSVGRPAGGKLVPHRLAAREGISLLWFAGHAAAEPGCDSGSGLTGRRALALAAVRIGLLCRMLDLAVEHLSTRTFGGSPIIGQQLVAGAIADVVTEIEALSAAPVDDRISPAAAWARHERLTAAGWTVSQMFAAAGFIADHPARALHVSALVADVWVGRR